MVQPEPPEFLRAYQPHLRYYLIDEGRYTEEELIRKQTPLSGVFGVENAGYSWEALQQAVDRVVEIIEADPSKDNVSYKHDKGSSLAVRPATGCLGWCQFSF